MGTEKTANGVTTPFEKVKLQSENDPFLVGVLTFASFYGANLPKYMGHLVFRCR